MSTIKVKAGDVIGFSGRYWDSIVINLFTGGIPFWGLSHVGIIGHGPDDRLLLFESTDDNTSPCVISGMRTVGVQAHPLEEVVGRYDGRIWQYPLYRSLYPFESRRLNDTLHKAVGKPYDKEGAIRAGGKLWAAVQSMLWDEDLRQFFCSELTAAMLSHVGVWPTSNASRWNPNHLIRQLRSEGIVRRPVRLK